MFLPVLLVRDYGVWGFVVFAVPNVLGAAVMGWVLTRSQSVVMTRWANHRWACVCFTWVTIAFQLYFLGSMALPVLGPVSTAWGPWPLVGLLFLLVLLGAAIAARPRIGSAIVLAVSTTLLLLFLCNSGGVALPVSTDSRRLLFLAPVCVFGFALCPYLDLTFHRARAELDERASRAAFSVGFCVFFLAMILGTLVYAAPAAGVLAHPKSVAGSLGALLIGGHIALQIAGTVALHKRELVLPRENEWNAGSGLQASFLPGGLLALLALVVADSLKGQEFFGIGSFELVYRCFMSFYGLVFPAYVWLCMIPTRDGHSGVLSPQGRRKLLILAIACLLAAPCYWMGFIERIEWWLAPGVGVVLLARFLVRGHSPSLGPLSDPQSPA
jgi:hypothetical protein